MGGAAPGQGNSARQKPLTPPICKTGGLPSQLCRASQVLQRAEREPWRGTHLSVWEKRRLSLADPPPLLCPTTGHFAIAAKVSVLSNPDAGCGIMLPGTTISAQQTPGE